MGVINYPLPNTVLYVKPGTMLRDQIWWKPAITGMVIGMKISKTGTQFIIINLFANLIILGDKAATGQGLKFTVGEILDDHEIPMIMDETTGKTFRSNVLLSTNIIGTGMGGQIREIAATMDRFKSV